MGRRLRDRTAISGPRPTTGRGTWITVQFYDGFAFFPITWLEGLGFCEVGEGHRFIEGGTRIARDGELPLNTAGGQLGAGPPPRLRLRARGGDAAARRRRRAADPGRSARGDRDLGRRTDGGGAAAGEGLILSA